MHNNIKAQYQWHGLQDVEGGHGEVEVDTYVMSVAFVSSIPASGNYLDRFPPCLTVSEINSTESVKF